MVLDVEAAMVVVVVVADCWGEEVTAHLGSQREQREEEVVVAGYIQEVQMFVGPPYNAVAVAGVAVAVGAAVDVAVDAAVDVAVDVAAVAAAVVDVVVHTGMIPRAEAQPYQAGLILDKSEEWAYK